MPLDKYPPRGLREAERLTRNLEKLANSGGRCWKDSLGRKRSFRTTSLLTLPEDWSLPGKRPRKSYRRKCGWTMSFRDDLKEKTIGNFQDW